MDVTMLELLICLIDISICQEKGRLFTPNEFMDGYYDGFYACSGRSDIDRDGPLGAECGAGLLSDGQLLLGFKCLYFNSCFNLGDQFGVVTI